MKRAFVATTAVLVVTAAHAQSKSEIAQNEAVYRTKCASCHSVACNRNGPKLESVIGRTAGGVADFKHYTSALKDSGIVLTEAEIDAYIQDPARKIPARR
jgi:cytochrome c